MLIFALGLSELKTPASTLGNDIPTPPHAYVPGQTTRHPEDWFETIKASVGSAPIEQTQAWQAGLFYLDRGYFWECHEVLEAVWMALPNPSPERDMTQAIIQLANARLKLRMKKPNATRRLCEIVQGLLEHHRGTILEIEVGWVRAQIITTLKAAQSATLMH